MRSLKKKNSKTILLCLLLIVAFSQINGLFLVDATSYKIIEVNDFSDFIINTNSSVVMSQNTNESVSFQYNGLSSDSGQHDNYLMTFDEFGSCYDFEYTARFNYSLTDINDRITFRMMMGSYYTYNGTFIGLPDYPGNEDFLFSAGLTDIWTDHIGYHVMYLYPNDVKLKLENAYGSIGYSGDLEIYATRVNTTLTCILRDVVTEVVYLEQILTIGVTKPINYLYMDFYTGGSESTVEVCAYYINVDLEVVDEIKTIVFGYPILALITSLFSILIIPVFIYKRSK